MCTNLIYSPSSPLLSHSLSLPLLPSLPPSLWRALVDEICRDVNATQISLWNNQRERTEKLIRLKQTKSLFRHKQISCLFTEQIFG